MVSGLYCPSTGQLQGIRVLFMYIVFDAPESRSLWFLNIQPGSIAIADKATYHFGLLGDHKLGREVQSMCANDLDFQTEHVHSDTCGAWFLRRVFVKKEV